MTHKRSNIFEGQWDVISSEQYTERGEWEPYNQFEDGEYWWEFSVAELIELEGLLRYEGKVAEHIKEYETIYTTYCYDIEDNDRTLIIDRSLYLEDRFLDICEEEWFSIEEAENRAGGKRSIYLNLINKPDYPPPYFRFLVLQRRWSI